VNTAAAALTAAQAALALNPLDPALATAVTDAQKLYNDAVAAATAAAVDPAVTNAALALTTAQGALALNPLDPALATAVTDAQATYNAALTAAVTAANAQTTALLDGAANKPTPLSPEAQQQLDSLLAGKIDATGADPTP
jgi:hypothetical protein